MSKTMLGVDYMHEAKNVSSVLGRESGVKVVFEGNGASTDGETIKLPSVDNSLQMDERLVKVARGYVDHEAAHVKWTSQDEWRAAIDRFKQSKENAWDKKCAMNALEDVRIERKLTALYAGSKRNIETLAHSIQMELHDSLAESGRTLNDLDAIEIGAVSVTWYGRQMGGYGQSCGEAFEKLDVELQDVVKAAVHKIDDNSTTKDMADLAEDLVKEFVRLAGRGGEEEEEEEEEEKGKGRKGDDGEGEEEDDSVPENSDDEGDGGDDNGSGSDSDGDDSDGDSPDDINDGDGDSSEETNESDKENSGGRHQESPVSSKRPKKDSVAIDPDELKEKSVVKELESKRDDGKYDFQYRRFTDRFDKVISGAQLRSDSTEYDKMLDATAGQTNVLRRTLERKLAAKMKRSWVGGQQKGRLDSRRLVGAYTGSENIYKQREDSDDIDTAVIILIDHSMSMSHGRIIMAAKACVALASALENTNISYAIQGFTTNSRSTISKRSAPEGTNVDLYDSFSPLVKIRYKEFGDKLSRVKGSLGGITETFGNCAEYNVDGLSVDQSGRELLRRPEKRKVLMVLSDGQPADGRMSKVRGKGHSYQSHLGSVVLSLMSDGIDVFGIGIESDAVSDYYPKYAILNNLNDLESKVISKMDDLLIGGLNVRKAS